MKNVLVTGQINCDGKSYSDHVVNKVVKSVCFGDQMMKKFLSNPMFYTLSDGRILRNMWQRDKVMAKVSGTMTRSNSAEQIFSGHADREEVMK
jgi:hypothetical protein